MKLSDYVSVQLLDRGVRGWAVFTILAWSLWCLLVKPGRFEVDGQEIELEIGNGALRMIGASFAVVLTGLLLGMVGVFGTLFLLSLLLALPLWAPALYVTALFKAWRSRRRHAKNLAAARAGLTR